MITWGHREQFGWSRNTSTETRNSRDVWVTWYVMPRDGPEGEMHLQTLRIFRTWRSSTPFFLRKTAEKERRKHKKKSRNGMNMEFQHYRNKWKITENTRFRKEERGQKHNESIRKEETKREHRKHMKTPNQPSYCLVAEVLQCEAWKGLNSRRWYRYEKRHTSTDGKNLMGNVDMARNSHLNAPSSLFFHSRAFLSTASSITRQFIKHK